MTQRAQVGSAVDEPHEPPEPTSRDVLEEHALHGILRAEAKDLLALGLDELGGQGANCKRGSGAASSPRTHGSLEAFR